MCYWFIHTLCSVYFFVMNFLPLAENCSTDNVGCRRLSDRHTYVVWKESFSFPKKLCPFMTSQCCLSCQDAEIKVLDLKKYANISFRRSTKFIHFWLSQSIAGIKSSLLSWKVCAGREKTAYVWLVCTVPRRAHLSASPAFVAHWVNTQYCN